MLTLEALGSLALEIEYQQQDLVRCVAERNECSCEKERGDFRALLLNTPDTLRVPPCWKSLTPPEMCSSCRVRLSRHLEVREIRQRLGTLRGQLTRACRKITATEPE